MFDEGFTVRGNIHTRTTNDVDLSVRLFTRTTDQVIAARVSFLNVAAGKNLFLFGHFNNFDLKALAEDSLMKGKSEDIVTVSINVPAHLTDAVRLQDTAITVTGKKTFTYGLSFGNLHVEILDGRKLDHFLAMVVTRNRPHTLTGKVRVEGTIIAPWVTAQQLIVKGTIDGVDLKALRQVVIFLNARQTVDASLVFRQAVFVRGNLQTVFLNGISLAAGYLTTSTEQTFNVNLTISSALATHVQVNGLVNSFNLPQEWNRTLLVSL
ncbi:hypothetical protein GWK47_016638 [Chionoecetes opilio]|uniref:Uncharacterized protein n=1 Tax=Chionoecetes opilio TaxID=41210 RepID=A0A8J4XU94_CHIOP|nr:hypothetical protein GWK47_016638 [Chionoecetes opilio]